MTVTTIGTLATIETGAKSFVGLQLRFGKKDGLVAREVAAISSV